MFGFFYKERFYTICYYKIVQNYFRNCKEITYPFWIPRRMRGLRFTTTFALFLRFKFC